MDVVYKEVLRSFRRHIRDQAKARYAGRQYKQKPD